MIFAILFILVLFLILFLNIFGLPANWIIIALIFLWALTINTNFSITYWSLILGLAIFGEIIEFFLQLSQGKKHGASTGANICGIIGCFFGAIFFAPLFLGLGAFLGALIGAWSGCFIWEILTGKKLDNALKAAYGIMIGKFLGTICKLGAGLAIILITAKVLINEMPIPILPELIPDQGDFPGLTSL